MMRSLKDKLIRKLLII